MPPDSPEHPPWKILRHPFCPQKLYYRVLPPSPYRRRGRDQQEVKIQEQDRNRNYFYFPKRSHMRFGENGRIYCLAGRVSNFPHPRRRSQTKNIYMYIFLWHPEDREMEISKVGVSASWISLDFWIPENSRSPIKKRLMTCPQKVSSKNNIYNEKPAGSQNLPRLFLLAFPTATHQGPLRKEWAAKLKMHFSVLSQTSSWHLSFCMH